MAKFERIALITLAAAILTAPLAAVTIVPRPAPAPVSGDVAKVPVSLLVDVNSGRVLFAREPNRRFAPASVAKVMTLFVALEEMKAGRLSAGRQVLVSEDIARRWNGRGTSLYLKAGQQIDVDTLLRGIATVSANDASVVLAESYAGSVEAWCDMMNAQARSLGMTDSHFATPNGWPDGGATYVSARNLVTLGQAMITRHPELYRRYFGQKRMTFGGVEQLSHDPTVGVVRGADGIKTGHTNEAGYNFLGSAEREGQRLLMVVGGARSEAERAAASRDLLEWGFARWKPRALFRRGTKIAEARVQDGNARTVPLVADQAVGTIDPIDKQGGSRQATVTYSGPLVAPIAKGAQVATLTIYADDYRSTFPLYAGASVSNAGPLDRLTNGVMSLFP